MRFLVVLFSLFALTVTVFASCPSEDQVSPCTCAKYEDFVEVECIGKDITLDKLKNVLSVFDKSVTIDLLLEEVTLGFVPFDFFAGFNIRRLELEHCNVSRLSKAGEWPLLGLEETLEELEIISSLTEDAEDTYLVLSHLKNLLHLELENNAIEIVGSYCFPVSLATLEIAGNGIEKLGDKAFAHLNNLESLTLNGNRFGAISRSLLPNPANLLKELILEDNAFTSVPEDLFSNMPALKIFSLNTNGIRRIEEHTFKSIWTQLETIDLEKNPIECDSHINWMINLRTQATIRGKCNSPHDRRDVDLKDLIKE